MDTYAVGTVEGYPEFDNVVAKLKSKASGDVILNAIYVCCWRSC